MDKESNLADHGIRKYENEVGVFTSIDPLWEQYRSWTPYQYAGNNPIMALDWNGKNIYSNEASMLTSDLNSLGITDIEFYYNEIEGLSIKDLRKIFINPKEINTQTIFFDKIINIFNEMISSPHHTYIKYVGSDELITTFFDKFFEKNTKEQLIEKVSARGGEITYTIGDQENDKIKDYNAYGNYIFIDRDFIHPKNSNRIVNLFHGIGHVMHDGKRQGGVLDFENLFRKSFYFNLELRDYDPKHPEY